MIGLREKQYLAIPRKRFDPVTAFFSVGLLAAVLVTAIGFDAGEDNSLMFSDFRSFFFVVGGTVGVLLFQFDLETFLGTFVLVLKSFFANPVKYLNPMIEELDSRRWRAFRSARSSIPSRSCSRPRTRKTRCRSSSTSS